jgi:hypothetical protein
LEELSTDNPKFKGLNLMLALGEMKRQKRLDISWPGGRYRVVEFSAHYCKVKGLNPQAYARRKKMAEKQYISWPWEVTGWKSSQLIILKLRTWILLLKPGERKRQKEARYIIVRDSRSSVDFSAYFFKVKGLILPPLSGERKWQKEARYIMARGSSKALYFLSSLF